MEAASGVRRCIKDISRLRDSGSTRWNFASAGALSARHFRASARIKQFLLHYLKTVLSTQTRKNYERFTGWIPLSMCLE